MKTPEAWREFAAAALQAIVAAREWSNDRDRFLGAAVEAAQYADALEEEYASRLFSAPAGVSE